MYDSLDPNWNYKECEFCSHDQDREKGGLVKMAKGKAVKGGKVGKMFPLETKGARGKITGGGKKGK